jgi:hypothetical protein
MSGRLRDPTGRAAIYAALIAAGIFLVIGLFKVGGLTTAIYQDPDHASTPVIAQLFGSRGSGQVTLGNYPWLESLFYERWTRGLPEHRTLWEVAPFALFFASIAVVGWTVARTTSRPAGLLVALALAVPAAPVISDLAAPALRGTSFAHTVLLSALLLALPWVSRRGWPWQGAWAVFLALSLAPGVASDPVLMVVWGAAPFLGAVALGWRIGALRPGAARLAALSCIAGTALGYVLERIAEHHGIVYFHIPVELASITKIATNGRLLLENVATFVHGRFQTPFLSSRGIEWVVAAIAVVAIPLVCLLAARRFRPLLSGGERSDEAKLLITFWAGVLVAMSAVFLVPLTGVVVDVGSLRYVTVLWPALLVLVAVAWGSRAVPWLALLVVGTAALGCLELLRGDYEPHPGPWLTDEEVSGATRFVEANDLSHGYAGYRDGSPLTWASDFKVKSYPVNMCGSATPVSERCQFPLHTMDSWYRPTPGVRTFYVWDDRPSPPDVHVARPPHRWGWPFATADAGHLHLFAYDYDLAYVLPPGTRPPGRR